MIGNSQNIFDLFTRNSAQAAEPVGPLMGANKQPSDGLFDDLLGILLNNSQPTDNATALLGQDGAGSGVTIMPDSGNSKVASENTFSDNTQQLTGSEQPASLDTAIARFVFQQTAGADFINGPQAETLSLPSLFNQFSYDRAILQQLSLDDGTYQVLNSKITARNLELTLQAKNPDNTPVTVIIPKAFLVDLGGHKATARTGHRPALLPNMPAVGEHVSNGPIEIDDLLARLKVQSLEIQSVQKDSSSPQVRVSLGGEYDGRAVVFDATAARSAVMTRISKDKFRSNAGPKADAKLLPGGTETTPPDSAAGRPILLEPQKTSVSDQDRNLQQQQLLSELNQRSFSERSSELQNDAKVIIDSDSLRPVQTTTVENKPTVTTPARFVLPDNLHQVLKPNGQAILIRVEPDHLGPAQLHLTMRGGSLLARITVHSPQAQAAVEQTVQHLHEQLSRAGVQVDRIEVAVGDYEHPQQFMDRRPQWTTPRSQRRWSSMPDIATKALLTPAGPPSAIPQYVNRYGVNLVA